jgi:hypothetical protein
VQITLRHTPDPKGGGSKIILHGSGPNVRDSPLDILTSDAIWNTSLCIPLPAPSLQDMLNREFGVPDITYPQKQFTGLVLGNVVEPF